MIFFKPMRRVMLATIVLTQVSGLAMACEAPATAAINKDDAARITGYEQAQSRALGEALVAETAADRAALSALFAPGVEDTASVPDGKYRCRTLKLGGLLPLTVYGYFECRISAGGTVIEKLTGSQRFKGSLTPGGDGLFYAGALHYGDEQPSSYGANAERNQVGCLYRISGETAHYRLDLPLPQFESTFDVIELLGKG